MSINSEIIYISKQIEKFTTSFVGQTFLVTGGAGFLGSWICDVLITLGCKVICLDNFSSGKKENIIHLVGKNNFTLIDHDISKPIFFETDIDFVLHLASRASPLEFSIYSIPILKANTLGTWVALGIARKHNARFVLASTSEVYGDPADEFIPTPESYWGRVNPVGIRSCYDESKRVAEAFTMAYHKQHGIDSRILRIHNTYGPRMRAGDVYGRVVTRFIDQAHRNVPITVFGDGTQTRSFTYVTDMVRGLLLASLLTNIDGKIINLGSTNEIKIIDLAKKIINITHSSSPISYFPLPPDDPSRRCPDTSIAKKLLTWEAKIPLDQGILKLISWLKKYEWK